jgi:hypothetical protein
MLLDLLDELQSLVESFQSVGIHQEIVFLILIVQQPIDSGIGMVLSKLKFRSQLELQGN